MLKEKDHGFLMIFILLFMNKIHTNINFFFSFNIINCSHALIFWHIANIILYQYHICDLSTIIIRLFLSLSLFSYFFLYPYCSSNNCSTVSVQNSTPVLMPIAGTWIRMRRHFFSSFFLYITHAHIYLYLYVYFFS